MERNDCDLKSNRFNDCAGKEHMALSSLGHCQNGTIHFPPLKLCISKPKHHMHSVIITCILEGVGAGKQCGCFLRWQVWLQWFMLCSKRSSSSCTALNCYCGWSMCWTVQLAKVQPPLEDAYFQKTTNHLV